MAKTYTIDEAADRIGIPLDEFKRRWKTEWTTVRTFRDGGTVRFRTADIDELARTLGMASDPGLQLASPDKSSTEYMLSDESAVGDDIFSTDPGSSARKRGRPADSDIRLDTDSGPRSSRRKGTEGTLTEELSIDLSMPPSGIKKSSSSSGSKLSAPKTGPNLSRPGASSTNLKKDSDSSSSDEFELSLDSDSDSFELNLNPDGSDEVDLGGTTIGKRGGQSGINLGRPADSGVSLELDSDDDLELTLDDEASSISSRRVTGPKSVKMPKVTTDSDSEFELSLEDNSDSMEMLAAQEAQGDIFETDFELPSGTDDADSASEVVAIEDSDTDLENSDFDLALDESDIQAEDESASQVVLLDDEAEPTAGAKSGRLGAVSRGRRPAEDDDAIELEDDDISSQLRDVPKRKRDEDDEDEGVTTVVAKPKAWGILPAVVLLPAFILTFLGGLMSYELVRGMWSYNAGTKPGGTLVRTVASWFEMDPKD